MTSTAQNPVLASIAQSRFNVIRCAESLDPQPAWAEIEAIYSSEYYRSWDMSAGEKCAVAEMKKADLSDAPGKEEAVTAAGRRFPAVWVNFGDKGGAKCSDQKGPDRVSETNFFGAKY